MLSELEEDTNNMFHRRYIMHSNKFVGNILIAIVLTCAMGCPKSSGSTIGKSKITFKGIASGGSLVVSWARNRDQQFVSILTKKGESSTCERSNPCP